MSAFASIQALLANGMVYGLYTLAFTGAATLAAWIAFFLHRRFRLPATVTAVIISCAPVVTALMLSALEKGTISAKIYLIIVYALCTSGLYFKKEIVIYSTAIVNVLLVSVILINPGILFGTEYSLKEFLSRTLYVDCVAVVLFFLTKWGSEYLGASVDNLSKLQVTMSKVENTVDVLSSGITRSDTELASITTSSGYITEALNAIAGSIQEEAGSLGKIAAHVSDATGSTKDLQRMSQSIKETSDEISGIVQKNAKDMKVMSEQINTIKLAVDEALVTVDELNGAMGKIGEAVASITKIANQTNLLALNAAIESAKAGQLGKGFAVVADEVKRLAGQSSSMAGKINETITFARQKCEAALLKVQEGSQAVESGSQLVAEVDRVYHRIDEAFAAIDGDIAQEHEMIRRITALYEDIQRNIDSAADLVTRHAATIEEISATTEKQNDNIIEISQISKNIGSTGRELSAVLERA
jgi:methyl-accepting chemotaxis protein